MAWSFFEFPDDVQLTILSFCPPSSVAAFALTSRRSSAFCRRPDLWRWGRLTRLPLSPSPPDLLYRVLHRWDRRLPGFWRRVGHGAAGTPPLIAFEWNPSCLSGCRIAPSPDPGSVAVLKVPFVRMAVSRRGEEVCFVHVGGGEEDVVVRGTVSFMGENHLVVEENWEDEEDDEEEERLLRTVCEGYVKKRRRSGADESEWRRRRRMSASEHFVKVANCCPTPLRPLQGLWKGVCERMKLDFFLVTYDDIGGIACRRVGDSLEPFSSYSPVFWTSSTTFIKPPFSREEEDLYNSREHILPLAAWNRVDAQEETVSRILCINSSYDLVIPDLFGASTDFRNVEGRIWEYKSGNFGFGFLRNDYIIDMKPIAVDGRIIDAIE